MRYPVNGKNINIPDWYIEKQMKTLGISRQEAVDMYLSDEGVDVAPEVIELTMKAKAAGTGAKATGEKKERKAPERKPDDIKRALVDMLYDFLMLTPDIENVEVTNIERMIAFTVKDDKYELTLTRKRKPKS